MSASRTPAVALAVLALATACSAPTVSRVVGGRVVPHRVISVDAYAAYARGAVAEGDGDLRLALEEYSDASASDARGVEPWTRRGAVACRLAVGTTGAEQAAYFEEADAAFARAEKNDPSFALLSVERARCALERGQLDAADALSARGLDGAPDDTDASLVRAAVLEKRGHADDGIALLMGLSLRRATPSTPVLEALLDLAIRANDTAARRFAEDRLSTSASEETPVLVRIDALLGAGDTNAAEQLARRVGLGRSALAVRAAALGAFALALDMAAPIVAADPRDADAVIATLVAAEALDRTKLDATLDAIRGKRMRAPTRLAVLLLTEIVRREAGPDAAAIVRDLPRNTGPGAPDALEDAVRARGEVSR